MYGSKDTDPNKSVTVYVYRRGRNEHYLESELARGGENKRVELLRILEESVQYGQGKGASLPRTGFCQPDDVLALPQSKGISKILLNYCNKVTISLSVNQLMRDYSKKILT